MALTKVKLIADGVITSANLDASHGITTSDIGEGSNLYYTDSRVSSYLSTNGFATQTDIVAAITDSAPVTLDTLNELAAALGDDPNFATTTATSLGLKAPLASPSFTGNATFAGNITVGTGGEIRTSDGYGIRLRNAANSANEGGFVRSGLWEGDSSRDPSLFAETGLGLRFYTGGSANERMRIDSSGLVTIGSSALMIDSGNTNFNLEMSNGIAFGGSAYTYANIFGSSGNIVIAANAYPAQTGSDSTITLRTASASGGQLTPMVIKGASVGIGTTPETDTLLHLEKNSAANTVTELLRLDCGENSHAAGKGGAIVFRDINVYSDTAKIIAQRVGASSASTLQFQLRGSEKMRIADTLITVPTVTEIRGDIGSNKFAIGNMGDASSQMMVSSRGFLTFNVSNTGSALDATERMRIDSSGRVGINVTPSYSNVPLHTKKLGGGDAYNIFEGDSAWVFGEVDYTGTKVCQVAGRYGHHSGINVDTAGQVGIGTSIPTVKLEIYGSFRARGDQNALIELTNTSGNTKAYLGNAGNEGDLGLYTSGNVKTVYLSSYYNSYFNGGNVRIGTTAPSTNFQLNSPNAGAVVGGSIGATIYGYSNNEMLVLSSRYDQASGGIRFKRGEAGSEATAGSITFTSSATSYNTSSDYRLKEDYQDFNGLNIVSNIPVYDFKWKSAEERSFGVKAHELQNILPHAVNGEKDAEEMQGVDYSKLTPILLKAIQELKADNDNLRERIQTLENQ